MNDKIRELAEQAGFMIWKDEEWNPGDVIDWGSRYDNELEKFAQLIVRECANIVTSLDQHEGAGDSATAEYIKECFGVDK